MYEEADFVFIVMKDEKSSLLVQHTQPSELIEFLLHPSRRNPRPTNGIRVADQTN